MELKNVLRVLFILYIVFLIFISIGLCMDINPKKPSDKKLNSKILNENTANKITDENDIETNCCISTKDYNNELLNLNTGFI